MGGPPAVALEEGPLRPWGSGRPPSLPLPERSARGGGPAAGSDRLLHCCVCGCRRFIFGVASIYIYILLSRLRQYDCMYIAVRIYVSIHVWMGICISKYVYMYTVGPAAAPPSARHANVPVFFISGGFPG